MKYASSLTVVAAVIIVGCGGSDDGGGIGVGTPPVTVPPPDLALTSNNGVQVLQVAYLTASSSGNMAGLVTNTGISADPGAVSKLPGQLSKPLSTAISRVPIGPETVPCDVSGTITVSGDLANPLTLSAGDTINFDADNCDDGLGEITDGLIESTVDAFSGDITSGLFRMTMTMVITDFQVTTAEDVLLSDGDVTVTLDNMTPGFVSASVRGDAMTTSSNTSLETLYEFLTAQTLDSGVTPSPYTMDAAGTVDSSELGGVVEYSVPVVFRGFDSGFPSSGELLVTGAGGSTIRLIALDDVNIVIEIDSDGVAPADETIDTTWAEFTS
jgi:hypothetical protein